MAAMPGALLASSPKALMPASQLVRVTGALAVPPVLLAATPMVRMALPPHTTADAS